MSKADWFRQKTWNEQVKALFFERLNRSRTDYNKAQYLRIQALSLQQANPPLLSEAIELIDYLVKNYPHPSQLASAYMQKAQCLEALGDIPGATNAFLASLHAEKEPSGEHTTAPLEFAMFVINHNLTEHFDRVTDVLLQENIKVLTVFPKQQYQFCAALAVIANETGHRDDAQIYAKKALEIATIKNSGLAHHPKIGLVGVQNKSLQKRLEKIARHRRRWLKIFKLKNGSK